MAPLDGQEPGEAHPRATEVAETLGGAFVAAALRKVGGKGCVCKDAVVAARADVEVVITGEGVPIVVAIGWCGSWAWGKRSVKLGRGSARSGATVGAVL